MSRDTCNAHLCTAQAQIVAFCKHIMSIPLFNLFLNSKINALRNLEIIDNLVSRVLLSFKSCSILRCLPRATYNNTFMKR